MTTPSDPGATPEPPPPALEGADPAPERIGDTEASAFWLERFCAAHPTVVERLRGLPGVPAEAGPGAWARFLAGEVRPPERDSREAEQLRYAQEKENH